MEAIERYPSATREMVELLIELGANVSYQDDEGCCPLSSAVTYHEPVLVACLLQAGADPNVVIERHESLLDAAEFDLFYHSTESGYDPDNEYHGRYFSAMREIISLLQQARAKRFSEMRAAGPREWLIVFAAYEFGMTTIDGQLNVNDLPGASECFRHRFREWLNAHLDTWPDRSYQYMPKEFDRIAHNLAGARLAAEIKMLVGESVRVDYYHLCAESEKKRIRNVTHHYEVTEAFSG